MLKFGYLDSHEQAKLLLEHDQVESSKAIIKRVWMDAKRKSTKPEMTEASVQITQMIKEFQPNILLLGDDSAANYIGNQFLDTEIPIVFWGINNTPVKYGLVDRLDHPGHNVTGVVEVKYFVEGLDLLKKLAPDVKTFAIISDETDTGRAIAKAAEFLARENKLPLQLADMVMTNEFEVFKQKTLELQEKVDAFLILTTTSKDAQGEFVSDEVLTAWYLTHIHKPEVSGSRRGVVQGLLCAADSDGYSQGFEGVRIAKDILSNGKKPATYPTVIPRRGPLMVNRQRAKMLGIDMTLESGVEEIIEEALALKKSPQ